MTQKAIKIKITMGNNGGGAHKQSLRRAAETPRAETVIRPNYRGISVILLIGLVLFGGGWLIFSPDKVVEPRDQALNQQVQSVGGDVVSSQKSPVIATQDSHHASPVAAMEDQAIESDRLGERIVVSVDQKKMLPPPTVEPAERVEQKKKKEPVALPVVPAETMSPTTVQAEKPSDPRVSRAQFTHGVLKREPVDSLTRFSLSSLDTDSVKLYFFSELKNLKGQTVVHRWLYENDEVAKVKFRVGGNRWRVYSSKNISANKEGTWSVVINDEQGNELYRGRLLTE